MNAESINKVRIKYKEVVNICVLFSCLFLLAMVTCNFLKAGGNDISFSSFMLIAIILLGVFNYSFLAIIIRINNRIIKGFRRYTNDSLAQIGKIKEVYNTRSVVCATQEFQYISEYPWEQTIILTVVSLLPAAALFSAVNYNNGYFGIAYTIILIFVYVSVLISEIYSNLGGVKRLVENPVNEIQIELKKLAGSLKKQ
jgi:Sec-independent protein translocase protein TatA